MCLIISYTFFFVERSEKYLYCSVWDERRRVGKPWSSTFQRIQQLLKSRSRSKVTVSNVRQVEKLNSDFHHVLPPSNPGKYPNVTMKSRKRTVKFVKSRYFIIFRYHKFKLSFSTWRTFDTVTFDLLRLFKSSWLRSKVDVQGFPTRRHSSRPEHYK